MPVKNFDFRFDPIGPVTLPTIEDWDLYGRVVTFRFYRVKGERIRRDGVYAHSDDLENTSKVITSFYKRIEGNYPLARMSLFWDYFINLMNSAPCSLNMARFFELEPVIKLEGYERDEVDFDGCLIACWRRYISALRKIDVKLMTLFLKRIIMPQVDIVLFNLNILNKYQVVVYRTVPDDSESLEVNPDEEWEQDDEAGKQKYEKAEILEARAVKIDKGKAVKVENGGVLKIDNGEAVKVDKGKGKQVTFDLNVQMEPDIEFIGYAKTTYEPTGRRSITPPVPFGPPRPFHPKKNGESSKGGAAKSSKGYGGYKHIEDTPTKRPTNRNKPLPDVNGPAGNTNTENMALSQTGAAAAAQATSQQPMAPRSSRFIIKSTINGCKKSVVDMKRLIIGATSRKPKTNPSGQNPEISNNASGQHPGASKK
ncbi:hypothetical protein TWF481_008700 [Arthrobotrys musiformis]|uniref:Uncharacterized protein n=1 Tax=Arthrobotrys musiformis TaxID=47236 RepID=A0AAV9W7Z4_9PEZI